LPLGGFGALLLAAAAVRFVLMAAAQNGWNLVAPLQPWSIVPNRPLLCLGLGVALLNLCEAVARADQIFVRIGVCILSSFVFFMPVLLLGQRFCLLGMLMIFNTLAYLAMAAIVYATCFRWDTRRSTLAPS